MNYKIAGILLILGVALIAESDAWLWRRRRRRSSRPPPPSCRTHCGLHCTFGTRGRQCRFRCYPVCGKRKRDLTGENEVEVLLPRHPGSYDTNGDGSVDINELATALEMTVAEVEEAFMVIDKDGNSLISEEEWQTAPLDFTDDDDGNAGGEDDNDDSKGNDGGD